MRKVKIVSLLLAAALLFSGCSLRFSSSIDDLIAPVSPFGDNADIKNALDEYAKQGYSLKTPNRGEYITAYSFIDIDEDKSDEAIVFYEPSDKLGTVDLAVIKNNDGEWSVVDNTEGLGADVNSLAFEDINGDGKKELIVCWDEISNSTNHELAVYDYNSKSKENKLNCFYSGITVNNYIAVDLTGDNVKDLLLFEITSGSITRAKAELYSFSGHKAKLKGETKLDSHISSYDNLQVEELEGKNRVYADAVKTDGSSMLTELVYWSPGYSTIISPFYSYSSGVSSGTTRSVLLKSRDINGDGRIDIPCDKSIKKLPKTVSCTDWRVYKNTTLIHVAYSLSPKTDGYLVIIPNKLIEKIKVNYDSKNKLMTVLSTEDGKEAFSVKVVLKATYSAKKFSGYTTVFEDKGYYYIAKTGDSEKIKISIDDLKKYIKTTSREE